MISRKGAFAGAAPPSAPQVQARSVKYRENQEHFLRRLGGALVLQWDALPDALQDLLIDQAALVEDRETAANTPDDIERFIRNAKTTALTKKPEAPEA